MRLQFFCCSPQHLTVLKYEAEAAKLRVENTIDEALFWSPLFAKIRTEDPIVTLDAEREPLDDLQVRSSKAMIDSLFSFLRSKQELTREFAVAPFWIVVEKSVLRLGAALLRCADFSDHLFLLNHLTYCFRAENWRAASLIQFPVYENWNQRECAHFCTMLLRLLSPVAKSTILAADMPPSSADIQRILTTLDAANPTRPFLISEDDMIAYLKQFPFDELLSSILCISNDFAGLSSLTVRQTTIKPTDPPPD